MRLLHKSEAAFLVFLLLLLGAGGSIGYGLNILEGEGKAAISIETMRDEIHELSRLMYLAGGLIACSVAFGLAVIFPILYRQNREQGQLRAMTETLSQRSENLQHAALTDGLTGMQNRRYFDQALGQYLEEFSRIDKPVGLMVLDLDHFKSVNDTHGHDVGDLVLKAVANCLKEFTRYHDIVARLGGEEFAVVAPNMDGDSLAKLADRIRRAVAALVIESGNVRLKVTTSIGLAIWDGSEDGDSFYKRADKNLYRAKREGRNRVCA